MYVSYTHLDVYKRQIYEYLHYVTRERANSPAARALKLSSLKGFFKYLCSKMKLLENNPTDDVDTPALKKSLPKYLTLSEGIELLKNIQSDFYERDYCIITLFLNCGMRLSELVNINAVSYTHLDVYKRQPAGLPEVYGR